MNIHLIDDGFGNQLEAAGSWYLENPKAELPIGMIRANYIQALRFFGCGSDPYKEYVPTSHHEIAPGLWAQKGNEFRKIVI